MSRRMFGWSLPPGVTRLPGEEPAICAVCEHDADAGECVCAECPVCHEIGNPRCYQPVNQRWQQAGDALISNPQTDGHGMKITREIAVARAQAQLAQLREQIGETERDIEQLKCGGDFSEDINHYGGS